MYKCLCHYKPNQNKKVTNQEKAVSTIAECRSSIDSISRRYCMFMINKKPQCASTNRNAAHVQMFMLRTPSFQVRSRSWYTRLTEIRWLIKGAWSDLSLLSHRHLWAPSVYAGQFQRSVAMTKNKNNKNKDCVMYSIHKYITPSFMHTKHVKLFMINIG